LSAPTNNGLERGFIHTLADDVQIALERLLTQDSPLHRREALRSTFAAIEGAAWIYRQHISRVANDLDLLTPLLELALQEKSYLVSDRGELIEQTRFVSLPAMVRLTTDIAKRVNPAFTWNFGDDGWEKLKRAIQVRNRLTHPKTNADLRVTLNDVNIARAGFFWLLALVIEGMEAANRSMTQWNKEAHWLLDGLRNGDPEAWATYRRALNEH
jgi:hypothetical protein